MSYDYATMTADLIARMSQPQDCALCVTCHARIPTAHADIDDTQCAGCSADDACDDIELEAVTRPLLTHREEAAHV